jgi:hypothetical protein
MLLGATSLNRTVARFGPMFRAILWPDRIAYHVHLGPRRRPAVFLLPILARNSRRNGHNLASLRFLFFNAIPSVDSPYRALSQLRLRVAGLIKGQISSLDACDLHGPALVCRKNNECVPQLASSIFWEGRIPEMEAVCDTLGDVPQRPVRLKNEKPIAHCDLRVQAFKTRSPGSGNLATLLDYCVVASFDLGSMSPLTIK